MQQLVLFKISIKKVSIMKIWYLTGIIIIILIISINPKTSRGQFESM